MISEIDIKDWDRSIKEARRAVDNLDDYAKMEVGVNPTGDTFYLESFIDKVEILINTGFRKPQIAALLQPPKKD